MSWIFLALAAHFSWAFVNIGDKYIIHNRMRSPYVYLMWLSVLGISALLIIPFVDFQIPVGIDWLWLLIGSAAYLYGGLPYVKAVQIEEITRINVWWGLIPLFSFVLGWVFLSEKLTGIELLAFGFLFVGSIAASIRIQRSMIKFSKAFGLMIISCFAFAVYAVIFRHVTQTLPFASAFIWLSAISSILSLTFFAAKSFREEFHTAITTLKPKLAAGVVSVTILDSIGLLFNIWALSLGPVALVYAFEGSQVLFVFILATGISLFGRKILDEDLSLQNILMKLIAAGLMIVGILLLHSG